MESRWGSRIRRKERSDAHRPARTMLVLLLLGCATVMTLDYRGGPESPIAPVRQAVGEVIGPAETAADAAVRPFTVIPEWFQTQAELRREVAALQAQNTDLASRVTTQQIDQQRLAEYDGLARTASDTGYSLVPARVVAMGAAQSFSRTVTIDAGSEAGLRPDMTVLNNDGLVGRVLAVTSTTATVLLILDSESVVGGRISSSMKVGMVNGKGDIGKASTLDLEFVDPSAVPTDGDVVVTWGSRDPAASGQPDRSGPYVAGIPIGRVVSVATTPRDSTLVAQVAPMVDFGALDLVGVVVPKGTPSDRTLVEAEAR